MAAGSSSDASATRGGRGRSTRQFEAVRDALADVDEFRSAQDIYAALRAAGDRVGLATVYRALQSLAESGEADVLRTPDGESVYRACSRTHHHHLVCRTCGRAVEVQGPAVERWTDRMATEHGFSDVSHTLELFGICPPCRQSGAG